MFTGSLPLLQDEIMERTSLAGDATLNVDAAYSVVTMELTISSINTFLLMVG